MKISKKAQYALTAMVHLARKKAQKVAGLGRGRNAVSIREISNIEKVPFEFLSKIFSVLEKAGLVRAIYGSNGGYVLAKSPGKISAMDIVQLLEKVNTVDCRLCAKSRKCLTKSVWGRVDLAVNKTLSSITLADLVK